MSIKEYRRNLLRILGNVLLYNAVALLCRTLKIKERNQNCIEQMLQENRSFVLAFWHGSMLVPWYFHRNKGFAALVSKSKDGAMLHKILNKWNYKVIRGSSHTGGSVALGILVDYAKNNKAVAITPDGPKGPYHKMKAGAVIAAKKASVPLILLGVGYNKKRRLNSWDKFEIPKLFSSVNLLYSEPIHIDSNLSFEDTSKMIENCEQKLKELQEEANSF